MKSEPVPAQLAPIAKMSRAALWQEHEYDKLVEYDKPTGEQPYMPFGCHATPEHLCHGWAVVHSNRGNEYDLLALRIFPPPSGIPEQVVPLFASGQEAADWGMRDIENPSDEALDAIDRLGRKYERLRTDG